MDAELPHTLRNNHGSTFVASFDVSSKQPIGCTVVVYCQHEPIISANIFNALIRTVELRSFPGAFSVSPQSLIVALQEHISAFPNIQLSIDPLILALLQASHYCTLNFDEVVVKTATCRIPEFSAEHLANNMQDPSFGYTLLSQNGHPGDCPFVHGQQIVSIGSILELHSSVKHFSAIWGPSGLNLDFHFLLIFSITPSTLPFSLSDAENIQPALSSGNPASDIAIHLSPPSASSSIDLDQAHSPLNTTVGTASIQIEAPLLDITGVLQLLTTPDELASAIFSATHKNFFSIARNWHRMQSILSRFRQTDAGKCHDSKNKEVSILQYLCWSPTTYRNKSQLFEWAIEVSKLQWVAGKVNLSWCIFGQFFLLQMAHGFYQTEPRQMLNSIGVIGKELCFYSSPEVQLNRTESPGRVRLEMSYGQPNLASRRQLW